MEQAANIIWQEEQKNLTLEGEPVLELNLSWPQMEGKGALVQSVNRYYEKLIAGWQKQWGQDVYWCACVALSQCREQSRPFTPWTAGLSGRVTLETEEYLSISLTARETRGDRRALEYRWGDTWRRTDGAVVTLRELYPKGRGWRGQILQALEEAAEDSRRGGIYLDREVKKPLRRWFSPDRFALTPEGLEVYYPQCTLAPAVEGAITFRLPLPESVQAAQVKMDA